MHHNPKPKRWTIAITKAGKPRAEKGATTTTTTTTGNQPAEGIRYWRAEKTKANLRGQVREGECGG
jgi:hypothetical protein